MLNHLPSTLKNITKNKQLNHEMQKLLLVNPFTQISLDELRHKLYRRKKTKWRNNFTLLQNKDQVRQNYGLSSVKTYVSSQE